ncbi:hypothetical protein DSO57_1020405 [Entomophthora muscae]|uniref:Uncharacterized protein n=1 Tax=Entomophthora muscae TaxID=34485 RepID=A0ACC2S5Y0_9FUNG|nr:hypothetical protein DSO57_1020405 [Entomophthora muscae]
MNLWFNQVIPYLILVLFHLQSTSRGSVPHTQQPQETVDQPPKFYCPPGAPFGPVHFTEYPPNPAYLEFTLEEILIYNPEARTREMETVFREGTKITIPPLLFHDKYNYLPAYLVPMTPPLTLKPDCLQESVAANESTSTQIFGVMFITLTILIDLMIPARGPWALLGKLLSYIVKLAPILWWALPAGPASRPPASSKEPPQAGSLTHTPYTGANPPNADKDQATLDLEEKVRLRALGPHICITDFKPAQFNAFEQLFSRGATSTSAKQLLGIFRPMPILVGLAGGTLQTPAYLCWHNSVPWLF